MPLFQFSQQLVSQPDRDSAYNRQSPPSATREKRLLPCLTNHPLHMVGRCSRTLFQTCKLPLLIKPLMSLLLTPGSFFGLRTGEAWDLQALWVQPKKDRGKIYSFYKSSLNLQGFQDQNTKPTVFTIYSFTVEFTNSALGHLPGTSFQWYNGRESGLSVTWPWVQILSQSKSLLYSLRQVT